MVTAFFLLDVERDRANGVCETLADIEGVTEVHSVSGRYDVVAVTRAKDNEELEKLVTDRMPRGGGILRSDTLVTTRVRCHVESKPVRRLGHPV